MKAIIGLISELCVAESVQSENIESLISKDKMWKIINPMKNPYNLEFNECVTLTDYLEVLKKQKKIKLFTHIANETYTTSWNQKRKNKQMGVKKGFPDYVVLTNKDILFIEMKRVKGANPTIEQQEWIEALASLGLKARVCKGFELAKKFVDENVVLSVKHNV